MTGTRSLEGKTPYNKIYSLIFLFKIKEYRRSENVRLALG